MKNLIRCLIFIASIQLIDSLDCFAQEKGVSVTNAEANSAKGKTYALIIGVSQYQNKSIDLNYADKDAQLFENFLTKSGIVIKDNITALYNTDATGMAINTALKTMATKTREGDTAYFYFSGHGDVQTDPLDNESTGYLLGHDANSQRVYTGTGGLLEMTYLQRMLNVMAKNKVMVNLILDACHSSHTIDPDGSQKLSNIAAGGFNNSNRFLSCQPTEKSYEDKSLGQGFFTYYLIKGMMGVSDNLPKDNQVTLFELYQYVSAEVKRASGNKQTPSIGAMDLMKVVQTVKPEVLQDVLTADQPAQLRLYLAARSVDDEPEENMTASEKMFLDDFNLLLRNGDEGIQKAYTLFKDGSYAKVLSPPWQQSFKHTLADALGKKPQEALNRILLGRNEEPSARYLLEAAALSEQVVSLLDTSDYYHQIFSINNKYLTAYSHIRNRNYRKYNEAERLLKEALRIEPNSAFVLHGLGLVASYKNNHPLAEDYFKKAIKMIPTWTYPKSSLGNSLRDQGKYRQAIAVFEDVVKMAPGFAEAYNNLAVVYQDMGMYAKAEELYKKSISVDTTNVAPELNNLGRLYNDRGNIKSAEGYYLTSIKKDSTYGKSYSNLGYLYAKLENSRAEDYLRKAVESEPFYADLLTDFASYYSSSSKKSDKEKADALYNEAILNNPFETRAYAGRGWNMYPEDPSAAEKHFLEGVNVNSDKPSSYYYLGEWYDKLESYSKAEINYKQALKLNPYYYQAYTKLSNVYLSTNRPDLAEKTLLDAMAYFELSPILYNDIGNFYYAQGKTDLASTYYKKALEADKAFAKAYGSLAYTALESGDYRTAVDQFKRAAENDPIKFTTDDFKSLFITQIKGLIGSGKTAAADSALSYYLSNLPPHPDLVYTLGRSLYLRDQPGAAAHALKQIELADLRVQEKYRYWQLLGWINIDQGAIEDAKKCFINSNSYSANPDQMGLAVIDYLANNKSAAKARLVKILEYNNRAIDPAILSVKYSKNSLGKINEMILELKP